MKIFITGIDGYVGSSLAEYLEIIGHEVSGIDLRGGRLDVKDVADLNENDIEGFDAVIHLAGVSKEPTSKVSPRNLIEENYVNTIHLARITKHVGARFIFASSASVYFTYEMPERPKLYSEDDTLNPISPYSITKRASEEALEEMVDGDFDVVALRKGTVYGASPVMRWDLVVNSMVKDGKNKNTLRCARNIYRPMLDIKDAVRAYEQALTLPVGIYNVASYDCTMEEIAREVSLELGIRTSNVSYFSPPATRNYRVNVSKYYTETKFKPQRKMNEAIKELWTVA